MDNGFVLLTTLVGFVVVWGVCDIGFVCGLAKLNLFGTELLDVVEVDAVEGPPVGETTEVVGTNVGVSFVELGCPESNLDVRQKHKIYSPCFLERTFVLTYTRSV